MPKTSQQAATSPFMPDEVATLKRLGCGLPTVTKLAELCRLLKHVGTTKHDEVVITSGLDIRLSKRRRSPSLGQQIKSHEQLRRNFEKAAALLAESVLAGLVDDGEIAIRYGPSAETRMHPAEALDGLAAAIDRRLEALRERQRASKGRGRPVATAFGRAFVGAIAVQVEPDGIPLSNTDGSRLRQVCELCLPKVGLPASNAEHLLDAHMADRTPSTPGS